MEAMRKAGKTLTFQGLIPQAGQLGHRLITLEYGQEKLSRYSQAVSATDHEMPMA